MTWARAPISRRSRTPAACPAGRRMRSRGPMQPALSTARCTADRRSSTRRAALPARRSPRSSEATPSTWSTPDPLFDISLTAQQFSGGGGICRPRALFAPAAWASAARRGAKKCGICENLRLTFAREVFILEPSGFFIRIGANIMNRNYYFAYAYYFTMTI